MSRTVEVPVESDVLVWARSTIGKTREEVAKRLEVSLDTVQKWETAEKHPTLRQLRAMSKFYKRPLAAFFLPSAPQEQPPPTDFRSLPSKTQKPYSEKTLLVMRRARRIQRLIGELTEGRPREGADFLAKAKLSEAPGAWTKETRTRLRVTVEAQLKWKDEAVALSEWRKAVEAAGVYVLELPFPLEEGRAFSLAEKNNPAIVLNSSDAQAGRIFSLFHEYAHLLLGEGGICDLSEENKEGENKETEQFCNRFAGEFLVPTENFVVHPVFERHSSSPIWSDEELQRIGCDFKVSRDVVLRRLLSLNRTTGVFYKGKTREWETKRKPKKRGGKRIPFRQCVRQNGRPFVTMVLESARSRTITRRDVSDYLDISLKYLPQVESIVREKSERYA